MSVTSRRYALCASRALLLGALARRIGAPRKKLFVLQENLSLVRAGWPRPSISKKEYADDYVAPMLKDLMEEKQ